MAKAKTDFQDEETEPAPRGPDIESTIEAIRERRAKDRARKGNAGKPRVITNYLDAERLHRLGALTAEETVDCEEAGLIQAPEPSPGGQAA